MSNYEYIVIGAGSAGCAVAARLSEAGKQVLLLEAGKNLTTMMMRMPTGFFEVYSDERYNWNYTAEVSQGLGNRATPLPRGRVLGGSSSINALVYLRGNPADYDGWSKDGLPEWSYQKCLPYFKKMESSDLGPSEYRGGNGPVSVKQGKLESPLFDAFLGASSEAGHNISNDLNGADPEGMGRLDANIRNGERCSAADAYVRPALDNGYLTLVDSALVKRIIIENGRAVGVEYEKNGKVTTAHAESEVVLSAGAYNSPQILMLSGIGEEAALQEHGIAPVANLPGVGKNLQDHLQMLLTYSTKDKISMAWIGSFGGKSRAGAQWVLNQGGPLASNMYEVGGFLRSSDKVPHPDIQYHVLPMVGAVKNGKMKLLEGVTLSITNCNPQSRGEVRLASADPAKAPILDLRYLSDERDLEPFESSVRLSADIMNSPSMKPLIKEEITPWGGFKTQDEIKQHIAKSAETIHHPCGTCRMGVGEDAVVDSDLKVYGIDCLRVIDASIMPKIITANTNCASIMIGEKGAAHILGWHEVG